MALTKVSSGLMKPDNTTDLEYTSQLGTTSFVGAVTGYTVRTNYFSSALTPGSGATFKFTGTVTAGKAGNVPNADGYFYDSVGRQFEVVGSPVSILAFGAVPDGVADCSGAILAGLASGNAVTLPIGTCGVSAPVVVTTAGQEVIGFGPSQSRLKALAGFVGSEVIVFGYKSSASTRIGISGRGFTVDCNNISGLEGVGIYGLRDTSQFNRIYVTGNNNATGIRTGLANSGAGAAGGLMNQGVQFLNCHVITSQNQSAKAFWVLDGLFESQLIGCKALGSSVATITDSIGFQLGNYSQCRGVSLNSCSAGNLGTSGNTGIHYGQWARECWDQFSTLENIQGTGVKFHGSLASGNLEPAVCKSLDPRPYNSGVAGVLDPLYTFGDANACYAGTITYYDTGKVWARFDAPVASQLNNFFELTGAVAPTSILSSIVSFDASASASCLAFGYSSDTTAARKYFRYNKGGQTERFEANGYYEIHDAFWSTLYLPTANKLRIRDSAGNTMIEYNAASNYIIPYIPTIFGGAWNSTSMFRFGVHRLWVDATGDLRIKNGTPTSDLDGTVVGTQT